MEILGISIIAVAILMLVGAIMSPSHEDRERDHIYTVRLLERDPLVGPEGFRDGEVRDIIWIDQSLKKVRWDQTYGSWRLVK